MIEFSTVWLLVIWGLIIVLDDIVHLEIAQFGDLQLACLFAKCIDLPNLFLDHCIRCD